MAAIPGRHPHASCRREEAIVEGPWPFGALHGLTKSAREVGLMQWVLLVSILVVVSGYLVGQFLSGTMAGEGEGSIQDTATPETGSDRELKAA